VRWAVDRSRARAKELHCQDLVRFVPRVLQLVNEGFPRLRVAACKSERVSLGKPGEVTASSA